MATDDDVPRATLTAIVPCNDLDRSEAFYRRLGFRRDADDDDPHSEYRMLTDADGASVHLTDAVEGREPGRASRCLFAARRAPSRHQRTCR